LKATVITIITSCCLSKIGCQTLLMKRNIPTDRGFDSESAFGRIELFGVIISMAILVCLCAPALARTRPKSELVVCANNLRQIGNAWRIWASDHADRWPWATPVSSKGSANQPNAWQHFLVVSNELRTPSILACPSDTRRPAQDFSRALNGLQWPGTGENNAVSYFVGVDAVLTVPTTILSGDRHVGGSGAPKVSSSRMPDAGPIFYELNRTDGINGSLTWTNSIHGP